MNYLKLTKKQEDRLIEMTEALFPEYYEVQDNAKSVDIDNYEPAGGAGKFISFYNDSGTNRIHWLEFCITWLSHKLIHKENIPFNICKNRHNRFLECIMNLFYNESDVHPVDYLYNIYK